MSNLSELLPTGGGQNAVDFVASGTLSSGQTVVLKTDGTVEAVALTPISASLGSEVAFEPTATSYTATASLTDTTVVIAYYDANNNGYGTAVVGTISGTSISFGTPVVYESAYIETQGATKVSSTEVIIAYRDDGNSQRPTAVLGTVSGTSISFSSPTVVSTSASGYVSTAFLGGSTFVVTYAYGGGYAVVGTISSGSLSFGSAQNFQGTSAVYNSPQAIDSTRVAIAYKNGSNYGAAIIGTLSGGSISWGTEVVFNSATSNDISCSVLNDKIVVAYQNDSSGFNSVIAGTISGDSISFGSANAHENATCYYNTCQIIDDSSFFVGYRNGSAGNDGKYKIGTLSGTSITMGSQQTFNSGRSDWISSSISSNKKITISYSDISVTNVGTAIVYQAAYNASNNTDFIGITAEAISNTATGAVNVYGGINEAQTGLTIGSDYYVQANGSLSTTASSVKVGQAISATTINMMDLT